MKEEVLKILDHYNIYYKPASNGSFELMYLCPFHSDTNLGSAFFNQLTGLYNCFSCNQGGNVYDFIARLENCSISEAKNLLNSNFQEKELSISKVKGFIERKCDYFKSNEKVSFSIYSSLVSNITKRILLYLKSYKGDKERILRIWYSVLVWINVFEDTKKYKILLQLYSEFYNLNK